MFHAGLRHQKIFRMNKPADWSIREKMAKSIGKEIRTDKSLRFKRNHRGIGYYAILLFVVILLVQIALLITATLGGRN
jgi:hypothetical protein